MTPLNKRKYVRYSVRFLLSSGLRTLDGYPTPELRGKWAFIHSPLKPDGTTRSVTWQRDWACDLLAALNLTPGANARMSIESSLD
jgi:hypothetical protein